MGVDSTPETLCEKNTLHNWLCPKKKICYKSNTTVTNLSSFISICFLDVYLVYHGGGLTTKRRQPLWTSVHISESMRFRTHVYWTFFLVFVCTNTSQNIRHFLTLCIYTVRTKIYSTGFRSARMRTSVRLLLLHHLYVLLFVYNQCIFWT